VVAQPNAVNPPREKTTAQGARSPTRQADISVYLLRPDTYIALADGSGAVDVLQRYFDRHKIRIEHAVGKVEYASE
jgi:hypothetical protein